MDDQEIRTLVSRLARPHASGGQVIERAAILAEGAEFPAIMVWITSHGGEPEAAIVAPPAGGLHSGRMHGGGSAAAVGRAPQRYVVPAAAFA
jgi:hypothetical protein